MKEVLSKVKIPMIAEGKINTPQDLRDALDLGAFSAVVGSAITRPKLITERFVSVLNK